MKTFLLLVLLYCLSTSISAPLEGETRDLDDTDPEDRRNRKRRKRPCGRSPYGDGRTFFDWSFSYVDVTHNYNVICGGNGGSGSEGQGGHGGNGGHGGHGGGGGGGHRPPGGGGHRPPGGGGLFGGHHQGGGGGIHGGGGGIFGGGGHPGSGGGIHGGGAGSGIQGGGIHGSGGNGPSSGSGSGGNGNGGLFGLGLFNWFGNNRPTTPRPEIPQQPEVPEPVPDKPNFDDDKPVHEDYDDVLPDTYQNWKPGQYITGYNPLFGNYVQDVTNFNPNRVIKQVNRGLNQFFKPLYDLFRR